VLQECCLDVFRHKLTLTLGKRVCGWWGALLAHPSTPASIEVAAPATSNATAAAPAALPTPVVRAPDVDGSAEAVREPHGAGPVASDRADGEFGSSVASGVRAGSTAGQPIGSLGFPTERADARADRHTAAPSSGNAARASASGSAILDDVSTAMAERRTRPMRASSPSNAYEGECTDCSSFALGTVDATNGLFYCGRCWDAFLGHGVGPAPNVPKVAGTPPITSPALLLPAPDEDDDAEDVPSPLLSDAERAESPDSGSPASWLVDPAAVPATAAKRSSQWKKVRAGLHAATFVGRMRKDLAQGTEDRSAAFSLSAVPSPSAQSSATEPLQLPAAPVGLKYRSRRPSLALQFSFRKEASPGKESGSEMPADSAAGLKRMPSAVGLKGALRRASQTFESLAMPEKELKAEADAAGAPLHCGCRFMLDSD
jgi:hypothetical protein